MKRTGKSLTILAVIWLLFTTSLVVWWWLFGLSKIGVLDPSSYRMIMWEGGFLVFVVLIGGGALVYLTHDYHHQHQRMKLFFSTFAHDLKTSITRLRLQTELLQEQADSSPSVDRRKSPGWDLDQIMTNIQSLDLQLENSLWLASMDENQLMIESFPLSEIFGSLRNEFRELTLDLNLDAYVRGDRRALRVVFRNLLHNSLLHGEATQVNVRVVSPANGPIEIQISDNGKGFGGEIGDLGKGIRQSSSSKSNGIGLFLTRQLLKKMSGDLKFNSQPRFTNSVFIPGSRKPEAA